MMVPMAVVGTYRLDLRIESGNRPQPRSRRDPQASMTLARDTATTRSPGPSAQQFAATITVPGYSRPSRRGRPGQSASWWPVSGDSIVVQFTQGQGSRGEVQLRGVLRGSTMSGEVWYVSERTGSTFQLGTFTAAKAGR
jgi:hypothetical protein